MSNFDILTQTFIRIQNAMKSPGGVADANRSLEKLTYPQLSNLLPYREFDDESGLFINKDTVGFLLKAVPLIGANKHIVDVLNDLVKSKLPRETPISFHLVSSQVIGEELDYGLSDFAWQGKQAEKFNAITRAYYQQAARNSFRTPTDLPLTLRNYSLYIACAVKKKNNRASTIGGLAHLMKVVRATLDSAKLYTQVVNREGLVSLVRGLVNYRHDQLFWPEVKVNEYDDLHFQYVENGINFDVYPEKLVVTLPEKAGGIKTSRAMNFMLDGNPDLFLLWQGGRQYQQFVKPGFEHSLSFCTHVHHRSGRSGCVAERSKP